MIATTDAVVLQARRFRESSKIVTLYTREFGKMSVVSRGGMQPRSRIAHLLQPMAYISAVIYLKEGRDLQNLSKAEPVERFGWLLESIDSMAAGLSIVELVNATMHGQERNDVLFDCVVDALRALDREGCTAPAVLLWFIVQLAALSGYSLRVDACGVCEEPVEVPASGIAYSLSVGAPLCREHRDASASVAMTAKCYRLLCGLRGMSAAQAATLPADPVAHGALHEALIAFVRHHVEGLRRLRVSGIMQTVLEPRPRIVHP